MTKAHLLILAASLLVGCGQRETKTGQELQEAFEKPTAGGVSLKTAPPELQGLVNQAVSAIASDDQASAAIALRELRDSPQLNDDQYKAVQDMMGKAHTSLAERAAKGDQRAIATLQMMRMNPPR